VGDAAGQEADRFQLLRPLAFLLHPPALGDIPGLHLHRLPSFIGQRNGGQLHIDHVSIPADELLMHQREAVLAGQQPMHARLQTLDIIGMNELVDLAADQFLGVADAYQPRPGHIEEQHPAVLMHQHGVGR